MAGQPLVVAAVGSAVVLATGGLLAGLAQGIRAGDLGGELPLVLGGALVQLPAVWVMAAVGAALFGLAPRLVACTSRPDNTMGSVYGTAETLLDVCGDPVIAASADGCDLDLDELLCGANDTLYLYAPASEQERLRPLFELLVSVVVYKAEQLAAAQPDGMLDPRLFLCLDEAGNCAAIKKLPPARDHRPRPGDPSC